MRTVRLVRAERREHKKRGSKKTGEMVGRGLIKNGENREDKELLGIVMQSFLTF